jgi:hypothetical protein
VNQGGPKSIPFEFHACEKVGTGQHLLPPMVFPDPVMGRNTGQFAKHAWPHRDSVHRQNVDQTQHRLLPIDPKMA